MNAITWILVREKQRKILLQMEEETAMWPKRQTGMMWPQAKKSTRSWKRQGADSALGGNASWGNAALIWSSPWNRYQTSCLQNYEGISHKFVAIFYWSYRKLLQLVKVVITSHDIRINQLHLCQHLVNEKEKCFLLKKIIYMFLLI